MALLTPTPQGSPLERMPELPAKSRVRQVTWPTCRSRWFCRRVRSHPRRHWPGFGATNADVGHLPGFLSDRQARRARGGVPAALQRTCAAAARSLPAR